MLQSFLVVQFTLNIFLLTIATFQFSIRRLIWVGALQLSLRIVKCQVRLIFINVSSDQFVLNPRLGTQRGQLLLTLRPLVIGCFLNLLRRFPHLESFHWVISRFPRSLTHWNSLDKVWLSSIWRLDTQVSRLCQNWLCKSVSGLRLVFYGWKTVRLCVQFERFAQFQLCGLVWLLIVDSEDSICSTQSHKCFYAFFHLFLTILI